MDNSINIIVTEDDDGLRFLLRNALKQEGLNTRMASCGKELLDMIDEELPDLLVLDYKLPDITVPEILDKMIIRGLIIPFIIITGHGDEKIAVDMMKRGAYDYLIKDIKLLDLLPSIVKRAAREVVINRQLKHTQKALDETEANYKLLAQNIADIVWTANLNEEITFVSPSAEKLLGYSTDEIYKLKIKDLIDPGVSGENRKNLDQFMIKVRQNTGFLEFNMETSMEFSFIRKDGSNIWTESRISAMVDHENHIIGILGSTRNIQIRKETELKLQKSHDTLFNALMACINAMGKTTEIRDPYTAGHQRRVAVLAASIAEEMKLPGDVCQCIKMTSKVHDLGKIAIPSEILSKPGNISENEYKIIKTHPRVGYEILNTIEFPWPLAEIILQHHERIDGSGYPNGITGNEMYMEAKIIAVADVVEAIASHRPYRPALGIDKAIEEVEINKGTRYDSTVVESCLKVIEKYMDIFS